MPVRRHIPLMTSALLSNSGPPLDDDDSFTPPWGKSGIGRYYEWRDAKKRAFYAPFDVAKLRAQRAALIGLTYDEYALEILERGRYLNAGDTVRMLLSVAGLGR
jgi:hypothetical protein